MTDTTTTARRESCSYRLAWDPALLGWTLTYDGQLWAFVSAYLPGRPQMTDRAAREWADSLLGAQPWQADRAGHRATPTP